MMITTDRLTKRYGTHIAVSNLDLQVKEGDFFGLLGPNGAGKTTTIRMLAGLLPKTSGRISVNGFDPQAQPDQVKRTVGVVCESYGYYGWMSGEQYLSYFADLYGVAGKGQRVKELLAAVGLSSAKAQLVASYSRGMRQRLGIGRALVHRPSLLMLDEPTLGLDPEGQKEIYGLLQDLSRQGAIVFLSSHSLGEIERLVNRIAVLNHGELVAQGTMEEIRRKLRPGVRIRITVSDPAQALEIARREPHLGSASLDGDRLMLSPSTAEQLDESPIVRSLVAGGITIRELVRLEPSLEDMFFQLTRAERVAA